MCDYSLEMYESRDALAGERVVTCRFPSGTQGFVSPDSLEVAVCLKEGTRLVLRDLPEALQRQLHVGHEAVATFAYLESPPVPGWSSWGEYNVHRDGLIFESGRRIRINELPDGLQADVLVEALFLIPSEEGSEQPEEAEQLCPVEC